METRKVTLAHEQRREEVLNIVARIINSEGVASATLSTIANELGVKHNTLYYYFKDRGDVHRTALYRTLELRESSLAAAKRHPGNALEQLLHYIELELTAELNTRIDPVGGRGLKAPARERYLKARDKHLLAVSDLVATGVAEGTILPCDPYLRAVAIDSILNRLIDVDAMMLGATMTRADVITGIIDALRHGILVPDRAMPSPPGDQREITALLDLDLDLDDIDGRELQHLLSNAIQAFNEHGWNASIPAMASRIGKSKTVYYQFSVDKAELLFHCLSRGMNLIAASQRASARHGSNMAETIVLHYRYLYRAHDSVIGPFPLFMEVDHLRPQHRRLVSIGNHSLRLRGQRRVQTAISEGWFRAIPPNIVQPLFGSMLYKLGAGSLNRRGGVDFERAAVENTRLVFEGLDANTGRAVSSS